MATVHECGFTLHDHPPYSPDLAPSDYFQFPNMKKHLDGRHYWSDEEVTAAVEEFSGTKMRAPIPQGSKDSNIV